MREGIKLNGKHDHIYTLHTNVWTADESSIQLNTGTIKIAHTLCTACTKCNYITIIVLLYFFGPIKAIDQHCPRKVWLFGTGRECVQAAAIPGIALHMRKLSTSVKHIDGFTLNANCAY